mmetsp:Transcript_29517/g.78114  ORF Transcript_29517/g.78114 Transcript_29517/m.78114 type:complete len:81 (-) Transcript_29517:63-305(-)
MSPSAHKMLLMSLRLQIWLQIWVQRDLFGLGTCLMASGVGDSRTFDGELGASSTVLAASVMGSSLGGVLGVSGAAASASG